MSVSFQRRAVPDLRIATSVAVSFVNQSNRLLVGGGSSGTTHYDALATSNPHYQAFSEFEPAGVDVKVLRTKIRTCSILTFDLTLTRPLSSD